MLKRAITTVVLIAFVCSMVWLGVKNYIFFDVLIMFFTTIGMYEMIKSLRQAGYKAYIAPAVTTMALAYPAWHFFGVNGLLGVFALAVALNLSIMTFRKEGDFKDALAGIFAIMYPYFVMSLAFILTKDYCALFTVAYAVFIPVATDIFAYLVGRFFGKHKLCPEISPKKTIEGAVGGFIGGVAMSVAFFLIFEHYALFEGIVDFTPFSDNTAVSVVLYVVLGMLGAVVAQLGDLAASKVKRNLGIKDYGNIFPGHGGALDRIDSIMYMIILIFIAFQFIY